MINKIGEKLHLLHIISHSHIEAIAPHIISEHQEFATSSVEAHSTQYMQLTCLHAELHYHLDALTENLPTTLNNITMILYLPS